MILNHRTVSLCAAGTREVMLHVIHHLKSRFGSSVMVPNSSHETYWLFCFLPCEPNLHRITKSNHRIIYEHLYCVASRSREIYFCIIYIKMKREHHSFGKLPLHGTGEMKNNKKAQTFVNIMNDLPKIAFVLPK